MNSLAEEELLKDLMPESPERFPVGEGVNVIRGRTLTQMGDWHKAIVLIDTRGKKQVRLYGWHKNKQGEYKVRQKFNISPGYANIIKDILDEFAGD